jgi:hypothetical protein
MRSSLVKLCYTKLFCTLAIAGLACATISDTAHAQGFFEQLFGIQPKPRPSPMPNLAQPPIQSGMGGHMTPGGRAYPTRDRDGEARRSNSMDDGEISERGTYRTLCVRMCDGYYFPISNSTTKKNFYRDQSKCKSTCGGDARLFVTPTTMTISPSASMEGMVDLNGASYAKLPVAFKYRKTLVAGCQCKPEPWSDAELDRHRRYAETEAAAKISVNVAAFEEPKTRKDKSDNVKSDGAPVVDAGAKLRGTLVEAETQTVQPTTSQPTKRKTKLATTPDGAALVRKDQRTAQGKPTPSGIAVKAAWTPPPTPIPVAQAPSGGLFGGSMGLGAGGGSKYAWPGDTPRR